MGRLSIDRLQEGWQQQANQDLQEGRPLRLRGAAAVHVGHGAD